MAEKLNPVDLVGIDNLLEYLVATGNITYEERDRIMLRIAKENDLAGCMLPGLAGYGRSKDKVLEHTAHRQVPLPQGKGQDESYYQSNAKRNSYVEHAKNMEIVVALNLLF